MVGGQGSGMSSAQRPGLLDYQDLYPRYGQRGPVRQTLMDCLNNRGLASIASHNTIGVGSCYSHLIFIFGSGRQFFNESVDPEPPKPCLTGVGLLGGGVLGGGCGR